MVEFVMATHVGVEIKWGAHNGRYIELIVNHAYFKVKGP